MTTRDQRLAVLRQAGYHNDQRAWMRAYIEGGAGRVSYQAAKVAWDEGRQARRNNVSCSCWACKEANRLST